MCKLAMLTKQWKDLSFALNKLIKLLMSDFSGADLTADEKKYFHTNFKSLS